MTPRRAVLMLLAAVLVPAMATAQERVIKVAVTVPATPEQVWPLWTTDEGVRSFFAPSSHIELKVDGAYEIFFEPTAPVGLRGADGMRLLVVEPNKRLAFTWNAPVNLAYVRAQRTVVFVDFVPVGKDSTRVTLQHAGWGTGREWDEAIRYFEPAWNSFVMASFKRRIEHGPINWQSLPKLQPVQKSAIVHLVADK